MISRQWSGQAVLHFDGTPCTRLLFFNVPDAQHPHKSVNNAQNLMLFLIIRSKFRETVLHEIAHLEMISFHDVTNGEDYIVYSKRK
jgi:hypothetical protein